LHFGHEIGNLQVKGIGLLFRGEFGVEQFVKSFVGFFQFSLGFQATFGMINVSSR